MNAHLGRRRDVAPAIDVVRQSGVEPRRVGAPALRQPAQPGAVEADPVDVEPYRAPLRSREVDDAGVFVDAVQGADLPLAARDGGEHRPRPVDTVQVLPPGSLAQDEHRPVVQPGRRAGHVHPRFGRLAKHSVDVAAPRVRQIEVEPGLFAVLHLKHYPCAVGGPADVDYERALRRVRGQVDPRRRSARVFRADHAEPHHRVRVARLRVVPHLDLRVVGDVVEDGERRDVAVVELQVGDAGGVRAPPVGPEVAAPVDLFLVDPVELAVADAPAAVVGELVLAEATRVGDQEVAVAHERDEASVGAEGHFGLGGRRLRQPVYAFRLDVVVIEVVRQLEDERGVGEVEDMTCPPGDAPRLAGGDARQRRDRRLQAAEIDERRALTSRCLHAHRRPARAPLHVVAVVHPGQATRGPAGEVDAPARVVQVVDGQGPLLGRPGLRERKEEETGGGDHDVRQPSAGPHVGTSRPL